MRHRDARGSMRRTRRDDSPPVVRETDERQCADFDERLARRSTRPAPVSHGRANARWAGGTDLGVARAGCATRPWRAGGALERIEMSGTLRTTLGSAATAPRAAPSVADEAVVSRSVPSLVRKRMTKFFDMMMGMHEVGARRSLFRPCLCLLRSLGAAGKPWGLLLRDSLDLQVLVDLHDKRTHAAMR